MKRLNRIKLKYIISAIVFIVSMLSLGRSMTGAYSAEMGVLQIYCPKDECSVFVDDRYYGGRSTSIEVETGSHNVVIHIASKNLKIAKQAIVEAGQVYVVDFRAESAAAPYVAKAFEEIPRPIRSFSYDLSGDYSSYSYFEPSDVTISGNLSGVSGFLETKFNEQTTFRVEGRAAQGRMTYDGELLNGTPIKVQNIPDSMWEARLLGRYYFSSYKSHILCLFGGLGYRYLNDDASKVSSSGYQRESNYYYYAVGGEYDGFFNDEWSWFAVGEYDNLLMGIQKSHLSDVDPSYSDATNNQTLGFGMRLSLGLNKDSGNYILGFKLFYDCWYIAQSNYDTVYQNGEPEDYVYEPQNNTQETGMSFYVTF